MNDLKFAIHQLLNNPCFTAMAVNGLIQIHELRVSLQ